MAAAFATILISHESSAIGSVTRQVPTPDHMFNMLATARRPIPVHSFGEVDSVRHAIYPPSIVRLEPVMKPAVAPARWATSAAISSGLPKRPSGMSGFTIST
jgi:hypothetical protein